jgi:RNA polymerase sigma-70 factor (ECF subfamily)
MPVDFNETYQLYKDLVYNLCLGYLPNAEDAEDATQEIFVKIHKQLFSYEGKSALKTWIYRIAINYCLDVLKSRKRVKRFAFISSIFYPNSNDIKHDLVEFNHPGIQLENKEAMASLFAHINDLPEQQKTALILVKVEQLSMKEAAEIMNKTSKSVESLLGRAKQSLKKKY